MSTGMTRFLLALAAVFLLFLVHLMISMGLQKRWDQVIVSAVFIALLGGPLTFFIWYPWLRRQYRQRVYKAVNAKINAVETLPRERIVADWAGGRLILQGARLDGANYPLLFVFCGSDGISRAEEESFHAATGRSRLREVPVLVHPSKPDKYMLDRRPIPEMALDASSSTVVHELGQGGFELSAKSSVVLNLSYKCVDPAKPGRFYDGMFASHDHERRSDDSGPSYSPFDSSSN